MRNIRRNSIVVKFSILVAVILGILLTVLITSNIYSFNVVKTNMVSNAEHTLAIHMNNIQNTLNSMTKDLNEIYENHMDSVLLYSNTDALSYYLATIRLKDDLIAKMSNNLQIDGMYIANPKAEWMVSQYSKRVTAKQSFELYHFNLDEAVIVEQNNYGKEWRLIQVKQNYYLLKMFKVADLRFGVIVKPDTLMAEINKTSTPQNQYVLTDESGKIISRSETASALINGYASIPDNSSALTEGYFAVSDDIAGIGKMTNLIESKNVFSNMAIMQWIIIALGILSAILIPAVLFIFSKQIIMPVLALAKATKEVEKGNWDYKLPTVNISFEFTKLFNSFSSMVKEIKGLKISSYEEKLERNKLELRYLHMQIKPHFFLNALTTISSLTYQQKNEEIRHLIQHLSDYIRYMFRGGLVLVSIKEEVEHVKRYIQLNDIRFPNQFFYMIDLDEQLEHYKLPHFIIQMFVENIFKHALSHDEMLSIFIKIENHSKQQEQFVKIVIEDNGEGFPDELLLLMKNGIMLDQSSGHHIGLANMIKTLQLLYKRDDLLHLTNCEPNGARVEILIPMHQQEWEDQHELPTN